MKSSAVGMLSPPWSCGRIKHPGTLQGNPWPPPHWDLADIFRGGLGLGLQGDKKVDQRSGCVQSHFLLQSRWLWLKCTLVPAPGRWWGPKEKAEMSGLAEVSFNIDPATAENLGKGRGRLGEKPLGIQDLSKEAKRLSRTNGVVPPTEWNPSQGDMDVSSWIRRMEE